MNRILQVLKPPPAKHRATRPVRRTPDERTANMFGDQVYEADALAIDHLLGYDPRDRFL